jgi:ElaB/YqjD/DUF883 family membrane-anchored ribosome-binding protein
MNSSTPTLTESGNASSHRASTDTRSAAEAIGALGPELTSKFRHAVDTGKARATEWTGSVQEGIRHDPIRSILIAATAGAILGLLLGRRSR